MPKWLRIVVQILTVGAGVAGSISTGDPTPACIALPVAALVPSPLSKK